MTTRTMSKAGSTPVERPPVDREPDMYGLPRGWLFEGLDGFDRMFDVFMGRLPQLKGKEHVFAALPRMDVVETDAAFEVKMDLPGMDAGDVKVTVKDGYMMVEAEVKAETKDEAEGGTKHRTERRHESVARGFGLPETVDEDKIEAHMDKGVITILLPKRPDAVKEERKIEVKGA